MGTGPGDRDDVGILTVDRLLDGTVDATAVPESFAAVVSLLDVVRDGVRAQPPAWGSPTPAEMVRILAHRPGRLPRSVVGSRLPPGRRHSHRLGSAAATVTIVAALGAGTAAAATGSLPRSVQSVVHRAAAGLGISTPAPTASGLASGPAPPAR